MITTVEFSPEAAKLLKELKEKYNVRSNKALIEKALMISAVVADELDDRGVITILKKDDGTELKLMVKG